MNDQEQLIAASIGSDMSSAEIGRQYAPEHIKDRERWGCKAVRKLRELIKPRTQAEVHFDAMQNVNFRDYKALHALRGTPPRPHFSRYSREKRAFNCQ